MSQSLCKLGDSYGSDMERVAQYVMRYVTRGTHVYQFVINVLKQDPTVKAMIERNLNLTLLKIRFASCLNTRLLHLAIAL